MTGSYRVPGTAVLAALMLAGWGGVAAAQAAQAKSPEKPPMLVDGIRDTSEAFAGKRRFGDIEKSLRVAKNILTVRLRKLVAPGVLEQVPAVGSAHREYAPTEKGRDPVFGADCDSPVGRGVRRGSPHVLKDRPAVLPVRPLAFRASDGRELASDEMELVPAGATQVPGAAHPTSFLRSAIWPAW